MLGLPTLFIQQSHRSRRAFSLLELLVVISVAIVLTGLMMPAMRQLHENAHRLMCMSNLQQMGQGFAMYGHDNNDRLPYSVALRKNKQPKDLMLSKKNGIAEGWDGIGLLFYHNYCGAPECYYCPSHHGKHPIERYSDRWRRPVPGDVIYTNYHYGGDVDWSGNELKRRTLNDGHKLVLAVDGLRTSDDFNHVFGMNVLRADISVRWRDDETGIFNKLPKSESDPADGSYSKIWTDLESQN
jgi:competence protein ComGC